MDIKDKLAYYKSSVEKPTAKPADSYPASLQAVCEHFNGVIRQEQAPYLEINTRQPLPEGVFAPFDFHLLSKAELVDSVDPGQVLFFDLETTGLAGGTGTFAFLIGFGWIEEDSVCVRQYFLPDFGREYDPFREINTLSARFKYLASYNGKSYDFPLLKNRYLLNRQEYGLETLIHIDLLHMARRLWKDSYNACDLKTLENHRLGVEREGDIPGAFIPQAYFDFIRTGVIQDVIRIITHNHLDITSLARLMGHLAWAEEDPAGLNDPAAQLRLAGLAYLMDDRITFDRICKVFRENTAHYHQSRRWQSLLDKKAQKWPAAVETWQRLAEQPAHQLFALEEMAKYYEHVAGDTAEALRITKRALDILAVRLEFDSGGEISDQLHAFRHRLQRLDLKSS